MKNFFKKIHHIVADQADDTSRSSSSSCSSSTASTPESPAADLKQPPLRGMPGWLNSAAGGKGGTGSPSSLSPSPTLLATPGSSLSATSPPAPPPSSSVSSSSSAFSHLSASTMDQGAEPPGTRPTGRTSFLDDEEYQLQMALEISAREDPEAVQIEAVKQISLGSEPSQGTPAEIVAYRYWNYNALSYDDKILDGFYDLYSILSEHESAKMPSLVDLQYALPSESTFWEAVLVNRSEDPELSKLEQQATLIAMESKSQYFGLCNSTIVKKIASLVSTSMGGPAYDNDQLLRAWRSHSTRLRAKLGSNILPVGLLTVGLARHRALLFKVLVDSVGIPCQLVKGKFHTGADDCAMNIVKLDDGRECVVDLMAEPGTLIPSDATENQRDYGENISASIHSTYSANLNMVSCSSGDPSLVNYLLSSGTPDNESSVDQQVISENCNSNAYDMHCAESKNLNSKGFESSMALQIDTVEVHNDMRTPLSNEQRVKHDLSSKSDSCHSIVRSPSWMEETKSRAFDMKKVKDVSQYMIDATKDNPQLAQKLHDVFRESGIVVPPNLFSEICNDKQENAKSNDCTLADQEKEKSGSIKPDHKSNVVQSPHGVLHSKALQKVSLLRSDVDHAKHAIGLGIRNPLGMVDATDAPSSSQSVEPPHSQASQMKLIDNVPVAAAVATAAIVASSMVVAAGNKRCESTSEAAVAVTASAAAALVATTAAVSVQHEQFLRGGPTLDCSAALVGKKHDDTTILEQRGTEHDLDSVPGIRTSVDHLQSQGNSDKSFGSGSMMSDACLDDVAEFEISWEDIILGGRIGLGSYGEVYRGEWHGTEVAVKKFLNQDISGDALEEFRTEVRIMKKLRHPNVVLFMGAVTRAPNLAVVTEFLHRGSLFRLIHRPNNQLDERRRVRMAFDVARGMNYLHNCSPVIVHRDLKSPNLLVDKNWVVKVCDFGLSRMKHSTFLSSRSTAGTAEWMAPEILRNEPSDEKCDVYSFGVILWELCTLQQPWGGMNAMQVVGAVGFQHRRLDIPDDVDPSVANIIRKCWETDSTKRPPFSEIMAELKPLQKLISGNQSVRHEVTSRSEGETSTSVGDS